MNEGVEVIEATIEGNRIKQLLKSQDLTQEEAARRVGVSYRHFNRVVLGVSDPSLLLAVRLQAVLGESVERIFRIKLSTRKRGAQTGLRSPRTA